MASPSSTESHRGVEKSVESSPLKEKGEPLLFPFLILEAKSEKSHNGFADIQTQTLFPISALLRLQENLEARVINGTKNRREALVWFSANRGDSRRAYGCYITDDETPQYVSHHTVLLKVAFRIYPFQWAPPMQRSDGWKDIVHLWDGCILFRDGALQLLLILDYIFDRARDIHRPSILKRLKALAVGQPYDAISLTNDSDNFSIRRRISSWIYSLPGASYQEEIHACWA